MEKRTLLIQPHSDDILFSASKYLFDSKPKDKLVILTVEYNQKRLAEDEEVCRHFDANLVTLDTHADSTNFHKEYYADHNHMDDKTAMKFCRMRLGDNKMVDLADELEDLLKMYKKDSYQIVTCLGVGHPFHWLTRVLTESYSDIFYRDFPHSYKRRNQAYLNGIVNKQFSLSFVSNPDDNHDAKIDLIRSYYKTQSSLLFFEKRYIDKKLPEEYYEKIKD